MHERTVKIIIMDWFNEKTQGLISPVVSDAVGYLSMWGAPSERYKYVVVACQPDGCIEATYRKDNSHTAERGYKIFALRNEKDGVQVAYSFHS